jgi:hypothetical protein
MKGTPQGLGLYDFLQRRPRPILVTSSPDLGSLSAALRAKLVRENVAQLHNIPAPSPVQ